MRATIHARAKAGAAVVLSSHLLDPRRRAVHVTARDPARHASRRARWRRSSRCVPSSPDDLWKSCFSPSRRTARTHRPRDTSIHLFILRAPAAECGRTRAAAQSALRHRAPLRPPIRVGCVSPTGATQRGDRRVIGGTFSLLAPLLALAYVSWTWIFGADRTALAFSEAEATMLFSAPVSRRALILYKSRARRSRFSRRV